MILTLLLMDLTTSDGGLLAGGQTRQWEWGEPTAGPVGLGAAWGTNLDGAYLHDTVDTLQLGLPDLTRTQRPVLRLRHWYEVAAGDAAVVEVDDGSGWRTLDPVFGYPDVDGFVGSSVDYVDDAWDLTSLKSAVAPRVRLRLEADPAQALDGWYLQRLEVLDGDVVPPQIVPIRTPSDTQDLDGPYDVVFSVVDDVIVAHVELTWEAGGVAYHAPMMPGVLDGAAVWTASIPPQPPDTTVYWNVTADDGTQTARYPELGDAEFRVFLAAPTNLRGEVDGIRPVGQAVRLLWDPPVSPHGLTGYRVIREAQTEVLAVAAPPQEIVLLPQEPQQFTVQAVYDVGLGDRSEVLELDIEVPQLITVEPEGAHAGDTVYVRLAGRGLYLDDDSTLSLGSGIDVLSLDVQDAHTADALIELQASLSSESSGRPAAFRDIEISGGQGVWTFGDRFQVLSADARPQISAITPESLIQGAEVEAELTATVPFAGMPSIKTDDDLAITGSIELDGDTLRFGLAANTRAKLGAHTLEIDDGLRRYLTTVNVDEYVTPPSTGCNSTGSSPWLLAAAMGLLGRRREEN